MSENFTYKSYEASAEEYAQNVADLHPEEHGKKFVQMLPTQACILDVGCGSGRDAKIFSELGLLVTGVDFSSKMIEVAKRTAPKTEFQVMNIEELHFPKESFDGIWANASLLHVPKKRISIVLSKLYDLLKSNGILYISVKKGEGEKIDKDMRYKGLEKFWSFFQEDELENYLSGSGFTVTMLITVATVSSYHTHPMINVFAKKSISDYRLREKM